MTICHLRREAGFTQVPQEDRTAEAAENIDLFAVSKTRLIDKFLKFKYTSNIAGI